MDCLDSKLKHCRLKDIASITLSLSKLNYTRGLNEKFIDNLIREADVRNKPGKTFKSSVFAGRSFIMFNTHMAYMGYYTPEILSYVFEMANSSSELRSAQNFWDVMQSGTRTLSLIGSMPYNLQNNNRQIQNEAKKNSMQNQSASAAIFLLDCLVEINCPQYQGIRLDHNIRTNLSTLVLKQAGDTLDHKLSKNILHDICAVLNIRLRDKTSCIYHGFLWPGSKTRDIAFCAEVNSSKHNEINIIPLPKQYKNDLNKGLNVVRPDKYLEFIDEDILDNFSFIGDKSKAEYKWFAVVAPQQKFSYENKTEKRTILDSEHTDCEHFHTSQYGPFKVKVQILANLGYNVIPVSYELLKHCKNKNGQHKIRKLINEHCVNPEYHS
jgi:hypothetical protein